VLPLDLVGRVAALVLVLRLRLDLLLRAHDRFDTGSWGPMLRFLFSRKK
jgi:hypothetical protein